MLPLCNLFDIAALVSIALHFGVPLVYYQYLKRRWFNKPWNLRRDLTYTPRVTIIVPTYNEAELIEKKLDNLYEQDYPKDKLEIIVVDSASTDGTPDRVREWASKHPDIKLRLLEEPIRRGMVPALNYALKHVPEDTEIVVFTDADAFWERDSLRKVVSYFADPGVGAVTTLIAPLQERGIEETYRNYYNIVRVAESKIHSTPVHNGALVAFRKKLLDMIGGLPTYTGNDDSTPASLIAFAGYRAIQIDDTIVREPVRQDQVKRKIRRAQHIILHFLYTKKYAKKLGIYRKSVFDRIWKIESYLHLANPWLLPATIVLLVASAVTRSILALSLLALGLGLLAYRPFSTWLTNQFYLVIAALRNLKTREIAWTK